MKTILVSACDTDAGKTFFTAALARAHASKGARVQIVKPLQSGTVEDAVTAQRLTNCPTIEAFTLKIFHAPLGPLCAAQTEGKTIILKDLFEEIFVLPACDVRIIEGAGGLAVPLDIDGFDWADFAQVIEADALALVVPDRLGAIHQARVCLSYAQKKYAGKIGIILNEVTPASDAGKQSNRTRLRDCGVPIWGTLAHDSLDLKIETSFL